jgi:hypothetical protein
MKTDAIALLFLTIVLGEPVLGQHKTPPSSSSAPISFNVFVSVNAPATIENLMKSGLLRRLRQFKDVEIVQSVNPTSSPMSGVSAFFLTAVEVTNKGGEQTGYAISMVSADTDALDVVKILAREKDEKLGAEIADALHGKTVFTHQDLYIFGPEDLNRTLDAIVADMDSETFEPTRQALQRSQ